MFDWDDLKAFLAVARTGSTLSAATEMGVNQTTVSRRLERLETTLTLKLFERGQGGSRLTEAGQELLTEAERVERAADRFALRAAGRSRSAAGVLRVTATEFIAHYVLMRGLAEFRGQHPDVQVDLIVTDRALDIEAGEADVAIRSGQALPASDLIARKFAQHEFALYCSRSYAQRRGQPTPETLAQHDLIAGEVGMDGTPALAWMFRHAGGKAPAARSNSLLNILHGIRAGLGVGPTLVEVADGDPNLVRCSPDIPESRGYSWIVTRRELKDTPRVRAFIDFIVPYLVEQSRTWAGRVGDEP
jgi:molybdate transport repressor ModE-like protein